MTSQGRADLEVRELLLQGVSSQSVDGRMVEEPESDGHGAVSQLSAEGLQQNAERKKRGACCNTWTVEESKPIVITDYNPDWPTWFAQVHEYVWPAVDGLALRIEHVGSTAVVGLAAKPIIDVDIVVAHGDLIEATIERVTAIGYEWVGDLGLPGREAFSAVSENRLPEHHLYLVVANNRPHEDHWLLRDLLSEDAGASARYAAVKRENARVSAGDLTVYTARKAAFVAELLRSARQQRGLAEVTYWVPTPAELLPPTPCGEGLDQQGAR